MLTCRVGFCLQVLRQPSTEQHLATGSAAPGTEDNPLVQVCTQTLNPDTA
jgi:hypothetical protein